MLVVPGTKVQVSFYSFTESLPPLFYSPKEGTLKLASINAGNSDTLCVGLGGVNKGFLDSIDRYAKTGQSFTRTELRAREL